MILIIINWNEFDHSVKPSFCWGVEPPTKFSERGGGSLTGSQFLVGVAGKEGLTFFRLCNFYIKNNLKSEIFNDEKGW